MRSRALERFRDDDSWEIGGRSSDVAPLLKGWIGTLAMAAKSLKL
jgi:hypothetical protein